MNFKRGQKPAAALELGGYSFDTIRVGAIIKPIRWFGVTESTGIVRGYTSAAIKFNPINVLVITKIIHNDKNGKNKTLAFLKYYDEERFRNNKSSATGFFDICKTKFNYRMEIIRYSRLIIS